MHSEGITQGITFHVKMQAFSPERIFFSLGLKAGLKADFTSKINPAVFLCYSTGKS